MCQAYEGEASYMRSRKMADIYRQYEGMGRAAYMMGHPRTNWKVEVVSYQIFTPGDDPKQMHTEAWWKAHHWDGPIIKAWLRGWDEMEKGVS